jgi:tetratricopeptide (TPR) repeat protein
MTITGTTAAPALAHPDELLSRAARAPRWPFVAAAAVVGAALVAMLVPRGVELSALQAQVASPRPMLEAAADRGDTSSATMVALARERLRAGEPGGAMAALRTVLDRQPNDTAALQALADTMDHNGRRFDAAATLEQLQRIAPNAERQRQLVQRYLDLGDEAQATRALSTLVNGLRSGSDAESLQLADRLMTTGAPRGALEVLDALARNRPQAATVTVVAKQMQALLAIAHAEPAGNNNSVKAADDAAARARAWLLAHPATLNNDAPLLAAPLVQGGHHDRVAAMLDPMLSAQAPALVATWVQAMRQAGRRDAALKRMTELRASPPPNGNEASADGQNALRDEVLQLQVALALEGGKVQQAMDAVRERGMARSPSSALLPLTERALVDQAAGIDRMPMLRELWAQAAPTLSQADPLLATRVASAAGDHVASARLAESAAAACDGKSTCTVRLAGINYQQGRTKEAALALKLAIDGGDIDDALLAEFARVSVALNQGREALAKMDKQRRASSSPPFNEAYALLATSAGRYAEVERWLERTPTRDITDGLVRELFKMAVDAKAHPLTVACAARLDPNTLKPADRVMLAYAFMDLGRTSDALNLWRQVRSQTKTYDEAYASALSVAVKRGAGPMAEAEYADVLLSQLPKAKTPADREAVIEQLVAVGAHSKVIGPLEALATNDPARWLTALETAALQAGQPERVRAVWRKVVVLEAAPRPLRWRLATQLLDMGDRSVAEQALRQLGVNAAPDDLVVQRLFTLWGQRLTPDQLDWVEARAQTVEQAPALSATDAANARAAWMRKLNDVGGATRTVSVYQRVNPKPKQGPVFDAYIDALTQLGDRAALASALRDAPRALN